MGKINVAIIGVGNCASSLVQGVHYYRNAKEDEFVPGLMHVNLGGYHISDINFVAAFDIDKNKVGLDLADAIYAKPNNTIVFDKVPKTGVIVNRGMTNDSLGKYLSEVIGNQTRQNILKVATLLHDIAKTDVLVKRPDGTAGCPGHELIAAGRVRNFAKRFSLNSKAELYVERIVRYQIA